MRRKGMNEQEIAGIRARCEAATPEPWVADSFGIVSRPNMQTGPASWGTRVCLWDRGGHATGPDTEFIAHARSDVPQLLGELVQARTKNERLIGILKTVAEGHDGSVCFLAQEFLRAEAGRGKRNRRSRAGGRAEGGDQ